MFYVEVKLFIYRHIQIYRDERQKPDQLYAFVDFIFVLSFCCSNVFVFKELIYILLHFVFYCHLLNVCVNI